MPLPIVGGFLGWLTGLFGATLGTFATFMVGRMVYDKAIRLVIITGFVVAAAGLTLSVSLTIKALIFGAQIAMPTSLGLATYFLPHNINQVLGLIVTIRVSAALYRWTVKTMSAYAPTDPKHGLLL